MMYHEPYIREGTGRYAVLLIHGIAGSPGHFRELVPIIPEAFSVINILLDGHNGTVRDFGRSSMAKWKEQTRQILADLFDRYEKVIIVAHSMGTLFAIQAAIDHPQKIPRLFLLNVPTRPWVRLSTWITALKVAFGKLDHPKAQAMRGDTGIALNPRLWEYLGWAPRMLELLQECSRVRKLLPQLTVPAQVFQSEDDELVSVRSCRDLTNPCIQLTLLRDSGHFVYGKEDTALLRQRLLDTLERI